MKIDRLLAIVMVLVNKKRVQAKELAQMFDVSVRTIYRDIESINMAGIPVVSYQGVNGGIGIAHGFRLDKNFLTQDELASITMALKSVSGSYGDKQVNNLLEKIKALVPDGQYNGFKVRSEQIFVDFSPWGEDAGLRSKLNMLKEAIHMSRTVVFTYRNIKGEISRRIVEPYTMVLKGQKWYLYGNCRLREDFRFFKVLRMKDLEIMDRQYIRRDVTLEDVPWDKQWQNAPHKVQLTLKFDAVIRPLVDEWFDAESIIDDEKGGCIINITLPEDDWLYGFILSFGSTVRVLEPPHVREKVKKLAMDILSLYQE